jgi:hypothetical protein
MSTPSRPMPGTAYVRAAVYGLDDQKEFSVDFWYSVSSGTVTPDQDSVTIATAINGAVTMPWAATVDSATTFRGTYAEVSNGSEVVGGDWYQTQTGTLAGGPSPADIAVIVRKLTAQPGKTGRGRWYFPCPDVSLFSGSYLNSTGIAAYTTLAIACKTAITITAYAGSVVLSPAHFSRKNRLLYPITNDPVVALLGTKRRRRGPF